MKNKTTTEDDERERNREIEQRVAELVGWNLKKPAGFERIDAHRIGQYLFRVNVLVAVESPECVVKTFSIAQSFVVSSDGEAIEMPDVTG